MFGPVKKLARLGQWNGRKRSTRQEPFFRRLGQRRVLMRVAVVWLTTATVAGLAIWWGEPMPYRLGAIYRHDLRARVDYTIVNQIAPLNEDPGGAKRSPHELAGAPHIVDIKRGTLLVQRGQPIQGQQFALLREEHRAYQREQTTGDVWTRGVALFLDAVSERGSKHLRELMAMVVEGHRAVLVFCVQRSDVKEVQPADGIDPVYGLTLRSAIAAGVEVLAYRAAVSETAVILEKKIPVVCPELK